MDIKAKVVELLNQTEEHRYAVISKNTKLLDEIQQHAKENVDFTKSPVYLALTYPMGIAFLKHEIEIVFTDMSASEEFLTTYINFKDNKPNIIYFNAS